MECTRCHYENADGARFCGECASSLIREVTCSGCGQSNPGGQKFCNGCGNSLGESAAPTERDPRAYTPKHLADKILQSKSALEGERKQVTVLFADVKGSTELAEQLDPEEWHTILDGFFQILTEGVHRFEGTVNQYTGDGIMALFGAPIAHEDHALRACHAALRLRDELRRYTRELKRTRGLPFATRMGISTGEVVVGKIGDDLRMDYTAQGATVNLAARLEALADPGSVYLAFETARRVAGYFELTDLGSFEIKGIAKPLRVHELGSIGPLRTRFDAARALGLSRFVGREREMKLLEEALALAEAGRGMVVGIVAPAGTGKTRLAFEFAERCRTRGLDVTAMSTSPWGRGIPLQHVLDNVRDACGIADADDPETCRDKIAGRMLRWDPELAPDVPLMFDLLGVPDPAHLAPPLDPEGRKEFVSRFLRRMFTPRGKTAVLTRDDVQWIDPASEGIFATLHEHIDRMKRLVVHTYRPDYQHPWRDRPWFRELSLEPLADEATRIVLEDWLGSDSSVTALGLRIVERASGNPFFLEELFRSLVEAGVLEGSRGAYLLARRAEEIAVPESVDAVLAARMDRLPEAEKALLQTASVIGKTLSPQLLGALADRSVPDLEASLTRLVDTEFLAPEVGNEGLEYTFVHPLTQEVAYRSQLRERRRATHARLAALLEERYAEQIDENAALLAHHAEAAGDRAGATRWHRRAARWVRRIDIGEAKRHWHEVLRLLEGEAENEENLGLGVEAAAAILDWQSMGGAGTTDAEEIARQGRQRAEKLGDRRGLARILAPHSMIAVLVEGDCARALSMAREAAELARGFEADRELQAVVHYNLSVALAAGGRASEALTAIEHGLFYAPRALLFHALHAIRLAMVGRLDDAWRGIREAREDAVRGRLLAGLSLIEANLGYIAYYRGDYAVALSQYERILHAAERSGNVVGHQNSLLLRAMVLIELDRGPEAVQSIEEIERTAGGGYGFWTPATMRRWGPYHMRICLAEACAGAGHLERARRLLAEKVPGPLPPEHRTSNSLQLARALIGLGEEPELAQAEELLNGFEARVRDGGAVLWVPHILVARARLARARGDVAGAEQFLGEGAQRFIGTGAHLRAEHLRREMQE